MKYQVVYESRNGNTRSIAEAIMAVLPSESAKLVDIDAEVPSKESDVYCIGYGVHSGICSLKLLDLMEFLNGKTILLFATCGLEPTDAYRKLLERNIKPFLPDQCDYRGMFVCQGAISEDGATALRRYIEKTGKEDQLQQLDHLVIRAQTHPDFDDLDAAAQFAKSALRL